MTKRLRVLLDVDEVLADFQTPTFEIIARLFGIKLTPEDLEVWDCFSLLTKEQREAVFTEIERPGWCAALEPKRGSQEGVQRLREIADVFPVTSHFPTSRTWVYERDKWLVDHYGFKGNEIVHTRAKYIIGGDALIDDNPAHVVHWAQEHPEGKGMLWHIPNTRKLGYDDIRVHTWDQVIARLSA